MVSKLDIGADIRSGKRPLTAAVIQLHGAHDEIMPSLFQVLLANGVEPTGYVSDRIEKRGDIFAPYTPYGDRVHYRDFSPGSVELDRLEEEIGTFDLLVLNTMGCSTPAAMAIRSTLPTVGIVHNPRMVLANAPSMELMRPSGQATGATLAPHATSWMMSQHPPVFSKTVTLGAWMWSMPKVKRPPSSRRRITVPGAVDFNKRDFPALLEVLPELVKEYGEDAFEIAVVGGGQDRQTLSKAW